MFGRERPDLGPVGSPSSPDASPAWRPGASRNENRARRRGCPSGGRSPPGRAGDGRGLAAGTRPRRGRAGIRAKWRRRLISLFLNTLSQWDPGLTCWLVAEERGALPSSRLLPCEEGFRAPLASPFRSSFGTSESSTVRGKGCEERIVRS